MLETTTPMDEYVENVVGINIVTRHKMIKALTADNAKRRMMTLIWDSPEDHITPEVRNTLKTYWYENFVS